MQALKLNSLLIGAVYLVALIALEIEAHDDEFLLEMRAGKTLELLQTLSDSKPSFEPMRVSVENLLNVRKISESHCNQETFFKFKRMIDENSPVAVSIRPPLNVNNYLKYWRNKQFTMCERGFVGDLTETLTKLSEKEKLDIIPLSDIVRNIAQPDQLGFMDMKLYKSAVLEATKSFLESHSAQYLDKNHPDYKDLNQKKMKQLLVEQLNEMCSHIVETVDNSVLYKLATVDPNLTNQMDKSSRTWITGSRICHYIIIHGDTVKEALKTWSKTLPKEKSILRSIFKIGSVD